MLSVLSISTLFSLFFNPFTLTKLEISIFDLYHYLQ